ncbi:MAG: hypothetical protein OEY29_02970 [Gammaproteobacteria bacterium]|nr:hypothetical protein [Gammaproteobacteria bacterium]
MTRFLLIFFVFNTSSALAANPSAHWETLVSEHFNVHYLEAYRAQAKRSAFIAEKFYLELQQKLAWTPKDKISIVVSDDQDWANGSATPYPFNRMVLQLSPADKPAQLEDYDDWLTLLIEHELTHIFHLDKSVGKVSSLRKVFGRYLLLFPNILQPKWLIEGLATHYETHEGIGRGQSSGFEMLMREEIRQGLLAVETVNLPVDSQPLGRHYLYGVFFYQFLKDRYGIESINKMIQLYSDNIVPFSINSNSKRVFGKDISQLWDEFKLYLTHRFSGQISALEAVKSKPDVVIVNQPHQLSVIQFMDDGAMLYIEDNYETVSQLMLLKNTKKTALIELNRDSYFSVGEDNLIYISQPEFCDEYSIYYDLYRYSLVTQQLEQLTKCSRYKNITVVKKTGHLLAARTVASVPQIDLLDQNAQLIKTLWSGQYGDVVSSLDWSDERGRLLVSKKELNTKWGIHEFDLTSSNWSQLVADNANFMQARYTPDQSAVLFSSDISGVYNIYVKPFNSAVFTPLTNVVSGAFSPVLHNERLYYQLFARDGYTIHSTDLQASHPPQLKPAVKRLIRFNEPLPDDTLTYTFKEYSPWPDLIPKYWFPWLVLQDKASEIGFITSSNDSLDNHYYQLNLAYGYEQSDLTGSLLYQYDNWLGFVVARENSLFSNHSTGLTDIIRTNRQAQLRFSLPFTSLKSRWRLSLGLIDNHEADVYRASGVTGFLDQSDDLLGFSIFYDSKQSFMKGNSPETGRDVLLVTESSDVFSSDYSGTATTLDWREYFRLGSHHSLALRYVTASADPDMRAYTIGGLESDWDSVTLLNPQYSRTTFNKRHFALRGYADNTQMGNHLQLASIEWRFPLRHVEKGIMAPPVGIMKHSGRLFAETGASWFDGQDKKPLQSVGVEWLIDLNFFYNFTPQIRLGYAQGLDETGDEYYYLKVGGAF